MLKPEEIKNVTFEQSVFSGYKKEDVDVFLDKVYAEYSRLYKENAELVGKLKVCVAKIEEYREDEKFLKSAIVNAQKLNETALQEIEQKRKNTEENARSQAEEILSQAKAQAQQLLDETNTKIADFREKTTREFAAKQQENAHTFETQKNEYEAQLAAKKAELSALAAEVEAFRAQAIDVLEKQAKLLAQLPETEGLVEELPATTQAVHEAAMPAVEEEPKEIPTVEETTQEAVELPPEETAEAEETLTESEESSFEESVVEEVATAREDTEAPAEEPVADVDKDQINIDDVLATQTSPVEPDAPIFSVDDDDEEDVSENGFQLFGGSPLIFPQDISDAEEEEDARPAGKDKSPRFRKKLKFGVDFDVKKDK